MADLLLAVVVFTLVVAVGLVGLVVLTVVPFVLALNLSEQRGASPAAWGAVTLVATVLGLAGAFLVHRSESLPGFLALGPAVFGYVGPALVLLVGQQQRLAGRAGRHE